MVEGFLLGWFALVTVVTAIDLVLAKTPLRRTVRQAQVGRAWWLIVSLLVIYTVRS